MEDATRQLVGWRSLAEAVPDGVAIQHAGEIAFLSETAASLLGADDAAVVGADWDRLFAAAERERLRAALEGIDADGGWRGTVTTSDALTDGVTVEASVSATADDAIVWVFDDAVSVSAARGTDADGRLSADDGQREGGASASGADDPAPATDAGPDGPAPTTDSTEVADVVPDPATIVETVDDGIYVIDEDLEFTYVNEAMVELTGIPRSELLGTSALSLFEYDEERELADRMRERALESDGAGGTIQATVEAPDGVRTLETRYRLLSEDASSFPGSVGVVRDVTEVHRLHRELRTGDRFVQNVVDALEDVVYVVDEDDNFVFWNDVAVERTGYTDEEFLDLHPMAFAVGQDVDEADREAFDITELPARYELDLVTKDGEQIPHELHGVTYRDQETDELYLVGVARDITDRLERERELERQRDELATLDRINELVLETVQELLTSASRDAVERSVCDRLASSDLYQFAWVGEPELDGEHIVPRVIAGDDRGYLEAVTITDDESQTGHGPIGRAMRTGTVQVANVDDPDFTPWREPARERGVESTLAVPLTHGDTVYGVLAVYANREDAFSERERAGFDALGRTIGFVFHAARSRELLFADEIIELEFSLHTSASLFGNAAPALECELELAGYVASGEQWILYVEADGASAETVAEYAENDPIVERVRAINTTDGGGRVEVVVGQSDLFETVTAAGATVSSARATPDSARLVVEAPIGADVRDVVEIVTREYTGADLVARREREREVTSGTRPAGIVDELTDRQRSALETALRAGYFDWPRDSTAEEVADSLGVAPSTLHGHLRKAERAVLSALLERR